MISARILGTGSFLPGRAHTTLDLARRAAPERDPARIQEKIGIRTRYWGPEVDAATSGAAALTAALEAASLRPSELRRIIFVSSTGGDKTIPPTVNAVAEALGIDDTCDGFDLNNACTGFLSAFDLAARSVATGLGPVAVVVAETFSRYLPPEHPRPYLVLGDAAAAVVVGAGRPGEGVLASSLRNSSALRGQIRMAHRDRATEAAHIEFAAGYEEITESALRAIGASCRAVAAEAGVSLGDVEWFVPHQPNGKILERVAADLGILGERITSVVEEIGSVGAASVPVSLDRLLRSGRVKRGDRLLLTAVGAGTAYGATLYQVAP